MELKDWGWKLENGILVLMKIYFFFIFEELLKIICCNCKLNCEFKCCNCKWYGIVCFMSCGECCGMSCFNFIDGDINFDDEWGLFYEFLLILNLFKLLIN